MQQLGEIGSFQFENLIRGRVPFQLILLGQTWPQDLDHELLRPIWQRAATLSADASISHVPSHLGDKETPVVLAAADPEAAKQIAMALDEMGYFNCYFLGLPWQQVIVELSAAGFSKQI